MMPGDTGRGVEPYERETESERVRGTAGERGRGVRVRRRERGDERGDERER
jgi:hypothetical protein